MLVSAVSANSSQTVFNTRMKNDGSETNTVITPKTFKDSPSEPKETQAELFERINEWKYFCHKQIEQGKFDIIA